MVPIEDRSSPLASRRARTGYGATAQDTPGVLSAIVDVFDTPCGWTEGELAAELKRRDRSVPPMPADTQAAVYEVDNRQLLDLLNAHHAARRHGQLVVSYTRVNRLDARGFTAEQVWSHRDHPSLAFVIHGKYEKPISEGAGWRDLSKMFADATATRHAHGRNALPLRDDLLAAAVLCLQKSPFKVIAAALAIERVDRCVAIGQRALGELAGSVARERPRRR